MTFNLDIIIIASFLAINLVVGFYSGIGIKTIKEYALGNRNFSTATLAATIIATWIGGSDFAISLSETYNNGLWYVLAGTGYALNLMVVAYIFSFKIECLDGSISVAETMGKLYGKSARFITAITSIASAIAVIAMQIQVFSTIFSHFLNVSSVYATLASSFVVISYSAFGGIKAVTFTDIIQFITFGVVIPIFATFLWHILGDSELIQISMKSPLFDYHELTKFNPDKSFVYLSIFLCGLIPALNPTMFQRILMAKNTLQIKKSFFISSLVCLAIYLTTCFIGFVIFTHDPNLKSNNLAMYVIDNYSIAGIKSIAIIGIMAMIMSTADSWINTASVIFSHDLCKPLGIKIKSELFLSRMFVIFVGAGAVLLTLSTNNLLELLFLSENFYMPIVTVPLMLAILGFRSVTKAVLIAMFSGTAMVIVWKYYVQPVTGIESVVPAMVTNLTTLLLVHYLLKEPIRRIKTDQDAAVIRKKSTNFKNFISVFRNFNFLDYCKKAAPKNDMVYIYFAFSVMMTIITTFLLDKSIYQQHVILVNILQGAALFISTIFICHKLWAPSFKEKYIGLIFFISVFVGLAFISSFLALISKFSPISLVIFIVNLTIIGVLMSWQVTFLMILSGLSLALFSYQFYMGSTPDIAEELYSLKFQTIYILFIISGFLLAFLKPKQEYQALTEQKNEHLHDRLTIQDEELQNALAIKSEFLRNITHEYHASLTGVMNSAEGLFASYDQLNDKYRKMAAENIYKTAVSLKSLDDNVVTLARICEPDYKLDIKPTDLSSLVYERVENCRKYYENNKDDREFVFNIQEGVIANIDTTHMGFALDNLIMNAIKFCQKGKIIINLSKTKLGIEFKISDEGIGIPKEEIYDIFDSFKVSSKTWTPAGGRGIGLALCKGIIRKHGGDIEADSDGIKGAIFKVILPE